MSAILADGPLDISIILSDINSASSILCVIRMSLYLPSELPIGCVSLPELNEKLGKSDDRIEASWAIGEEEGVEEEV